MEGFATVEEALEELRNGKLILVTDDEDRENEGDFICAAEFATTENINFMAMHGKGLICMPMSAEYVKKLHFPQMVENNTDNHETAFTVSVDYVETTTGISAAERSMTAMRCVAEDAKPEDFRRPGHMFPLLAKKNGVLERNGHTEATVDLCRLAGLKECGLCCEIMREDGTMMRTTELLALAKRHGIKMITIAALQEYRKCHEKLVDCVAVTKMPTKYGKFRAYGYVNRLNGEHHVALVKGEIGDGENVLCRVHSECLTGDTFGSLRCDCGQQFADIARSRLTGLFRLHCASADRFKVSCMTSAVNLSWSKEVTVRQTPFTAMLSPICTSSSIFLALIVNTAECAPFAMFSMVPISSMIPVNMIMASPLSPGIPLSASPIPTL